MVRPSPALEDLRQNIVSTGGAFLRNVRWVPGVTCRTCAGIVTPGYHRCRACSGSGRSAVDLLGFITYAWAGGQSGRTMYAYKAGGATSLDLVSFLVGYGIVAHWDCIVSLSGSRPDAWTYVPSLSGRVGKHPLGSLTGRFMSTIPLVEVAGAPRVADPRAFDPAHFSVAPTTASHVLVVEDTWTGGGHLQSVAAALKLAGVSQVTGLCIARWLEPSWGGTRAFIEGLNPAFNPDLCPYTGLAC